MSSQNFENTITIENSNNENEGFHEIENSSSENQIRNEIENSNLENENSNEIKNSSSENESHNEIENSNNEYESRNEIKNSYNDDESSHNYNQKFFQIQEISLKNSENSMVDELQSISKISKFSNDSIYESNLNILMEMGYSKNYIKKIFYFFKPRTLENAIELMTIENNLYIHDFFPNNKLNPNFCYICGESKKLHKNVNSNNGHSNSSNNNSVNNQDEFLKEKENIDEYQNICENITSNENILIKKKIFCLICDSNSEFIEKIHLNCHHIYCHECWFIYLKGKIENNKLFDIKCMNYECNEKLSNEFIMQYIESDEELIKKYLKFKNRIELMKRKDIKFCPFPDCEGFSEINKNSNYCKCNFGHEFCSKCNNKWHKNSKCKSSNENQNFDYDCKRCPNCKIWTQKNEGCNHMTCIECNFNWCWLCEKEYKSNHYNNGECKGKQYYNPLKLFFSISDRNNNEEKILLMFLNILFYFFYTISFCLFNTYLFIYYELYYEYMNIDIFIIDIKFIKIFYNFFILFYMIYTLIWNFCINVIVIIFASFFKYSDIINFYNENQKNFYERFKNIEIE